MWMGWIDFSQARGHFSGSKYLTGFYFLPQYMGM